jgi:hypothetical protein
MILNGDIPLGDLGYGMFLKVIPDLEKQWLLDNLQLIRLPSSPPVPSLLPVPLGNNGWLKEDFVPLDQEGENTLSSDVKSSFIDVFHI